MKFPICFENEPTSSEILKIGDKLGQGKFTVYNAYSPSHKINYALKIFPKDMYGHMHYNKEQILTKLAHHNIIKCVPIKCLHDSVLGILIEFAQYGGFLELIMNEILTSEVLIRTYFRQLVEGMEYLHSQNLAHLDLKLDNLVLGSDFKLKIIDFDQAQALDDNKMKFKGSSGYRPPEVLINQCKDLAAVDVYSAGIILFAFIGKEFPFIEVTTGKDKTLRCYSTFVKENSKFWEMKALQVKEKDVFSQEVIELLNGMLDYDVQKRFKIEDIKKSKWFNGPVLSEEELVFQMKTRLNRIHTKKDEEYSVEKSN